MGGFQPVETNDAPPQCGRRIASDTHRLPWPRQARRRGSVLVALLRRHQPFDAGQQVLLRSCGRRRPCLTRSSACATTASDWSVISCPSASGSSTSTCFCSEWIRSSLRSPGDSVSSAISRSATTGFLSLSRSTVSGAPCEIRRARWPARSTSSKRFSTLSMQSSTVTRAMDCPFQRWMSGNLRGP